MQSLASARASSVGAPPFRGARDCSYRTPPGYGASINSAKLSKFASKSQRASVNTSPNVKKRDKAYFTRILIAVGIGKILLGCILSTVGVLTLLHASTLGYLAAGLWGGFCLILTGCIILLASRYTDNRLYMVSSMCLLLINLAVLGLVLLFSSIGVSRDYWRQQHSKSGGGGMREGESYGESLLLNGVQCLVALTDLLLSLASVCVCTHQLCPCGEMWRSAVVQYRNSSPQKQWRRFRDSSVSDRISHKNNQIPVIPWNFANLQQPSTVTPSILIPVPIHPGHFVAQPNLQQTPGYIEYSRQHQHHTTATNNAHHNSTRYQPESSDDVRYHQDRSSRTRQRSESESVISSDCSAIYTGRDRDIAEEFIATTMQTAAPNY